jgi:hypothetical protein
MEQLLLNVVANASIPESYQRALPRAVAQILEFTPDALGLVSPVSVWGPRASSLADTLTHRTRGAGFAYELIGTAALIGQESRARDAVAKLGIHPGDRIDFGIKLQASYGVGAGEYLPWQPKRTTVEADLFIQRDADRIAVDFKHTLTGTYTGQISASQLDGIRSTIATGEVHEFHLVCNGAFGGKVLSAVQQLNESLSDDGHDGAVYLHEHVTYKA